MAAVWLCARFSAAIRTGPRQLRFEERDSVEQLAINGDGKMPSNCELGFRPRIRSGCTCGPCHGDPALATTARRSWHPPVSDLPRAREMGAALLGTHPDRYRGWHRAVRREQAWQAAVIA